MGSRPWKLAGIVAGLLLAGAIALVWVRRPEPPAGERLRRLWSSRGVARPHVVLITLDTTRAHHLPAEPTTPNLDALARKGVLFEQPPSVAPLTLPAHASIITPVLLGGVLASSLSRPSRSSVRIR